MTAQEYADLRPDLGLNWDKAHSDAWIARNPESAEVVAFIRSFSTFEQYLANDYGKPFDNGSAVVAAPTVTTPPASTITSAGSNQAHIAADAAHKYVGTDAIGDVWQLTDAEGNTVRWHVAFNADSRAAIPGTIETIVNGSNKATNNGTAAAVATQTNTPPAPAVSTGDPGAAGALSNVATAGTQYSNITNTTPTATITNAQTSTGGAAGKATGGQTLGNSLPPTTIAHIAGDPSHKYVGTDSRGDVWQLYDAKNNRVIEWAVAPNADSRDQIAGTVRDLGAPGPGTVAQAPGFGTSLTVLPTVYLGGTSTGTTSSDIFQNTEKGIPAISSPPGAPGATVTNPPGNATQGYGEPRQSDARHKYVGRQQGTNGAVDVWQIFDGIVVKQWAVNAGDYSAAILPGTITDLGPPGANTVAQADGTRPGTGLPVETGTNSNTTNTSATTGTGTGTTNPAAPVNAQEITLLTVAGVALKLFHLL